eukprot:m.312461 g.312461  ORF g.312461 m.312461 type:complete len:956 (-) comp16403_c0_seq6:105-2972(-)
MTHVPPRRIPYAEPAETGAFPNAQAPSSMATQHSASASSEPPPDLVLTEADLWKFVRAQIIMPAQFSNMKEFLRLSEEQQEVYTATAQKTSTALNRSPTRSDPINITGTASARGGRSRADLASPTPPNSVPRAKGGMVAGAKGAHVVPMPLDMGSTVSKKPTQPAVSKVELPSSPRATKKRKSVVHESQDDVDETENFEAFGEEDMSTGLELPPLELCADDRPPHEMVTSAKNGKVWVDDGLLKPTELIHFFTILGLCRDWLIRLAIAAHVEQLDRDGFVAFAKEVLRFAGNRVSKMALNMLKIKTRSDPAKPPVTLENKLRGRGKSSVFRELQPDGTFRSVTTWRPMYTTCVQLELQHFLREFTPGDSEDYVLLEPIFDRGLYVQLCERCNIPAPTGEMEMEDSSPPSSEGGAYSDNGDDLTALSDQSSQSSPMDTTGFSQDESAALDNSDQPDLNLQPAPLNVAGFGYEPCGCGQQVDNPTAVLPPPSFNLGKSNGFRQIFSGLSQVAAATPPRLPTLNIQGDDDSAGPADVFYSGHPFAHGRAAAPTQPTTIVPDGVEAAEAAAVLGAPLNVQTVNEAMDVDVDWEEACGVDFDRLFQKPRRDRVRRGGGSVAADGGGGDDGAEGASPPAVPPPTPTPTASTQQSVPPTSNAAALGNSISDPSSVAADPSNNHSDGIKRGHGAAGSKASAGSPRDKGILASGPYTSGPYTEAVLRHDPAALYTTMRKRYWAPGSTPLVRFGNNTWMLVGQGISTAEECANFRKVFRLTKRLSGMVGAHSVNSRGVYFAFIRQLLHHQLNGSSASATALMEITELCTEQVTQIETLEKRVNDAKDQVALVTRKLVDANKQLAQTDVEVHLSFHLAPHLPSSQSDRHLYICPSHLACTADEILTIWDYRERSPWDFVRDYLGCLKGLFGTGWGCLGPLEMGQGNIYVPTGVPNSLNWDSPKCPK